MVPPSSPEYAGDITPAEAWEGLRNEPKAQLLDVRTMAEWNFVGVPDVSSLGRKVHCVEWQGFPTGARNPGFADEATQVLAAAGADKSDSIYVICRSGARSRAAAIALTQLGFAKAFNVAGGFEGDVDAQGHRGGANGWKATGLPWKQS